MFRFFKSFKPVPLGRWSTDKPIEATLRIIDLANCDSCGGCKTCGAPPEKLKIHIEEKYLFVEGDVINIGKNPQKIPC
tara:strand:- start:325 stop:558 length:234 start_codon:yes stop_codon:yes gene_type:complete